MLNISSYNPFINPASFEESNNGSLGTMKGHYIFEQNPENEQVQGSACQLTVQQGDGRRDIYCQCLGESDFWDQYTCWNYDTVEEKGNPVCNYLPNEEESIHKMNLLPDRNPLHNKQGIWTNTFGCVPFRSIFSSTTSTLYLYCADLFFPSILTHSITAVM